MQTYEFIPSDTLFCRDQRPLSAGFSFGRGANWPLPTVLHSAIRTALLAARPQGLPVRVSQLGNKRKGKEHGSLIAPDFQWLNIQGPFPVDAQDRIYFPIPRDLVPQERNKAVHLLIISNPGKNNLPRPLTHVAVSPVEPSKDTLADWVSREFYELYLQGLSPMDAPPKIRLWDAENRIGVALADETHTAEEGNLYAAEHLRVADGVRLRFCVSDDPHAREKADLDGLLLQLGGERRFGRVQRADQTLCLPDVPIQGMYVKWVLLTPAIFINGWRPGWVADDGSVKLRMVDKAKRADRRRARREANWEYKEANDTAEPVRAKLVAAVVGKPLIVGGWDTQAKPTMLAAPSGSVYYFIADSEQDAQKLKLVLQGRCKSDFFGEKGLGLGVCGIWKPSSLSALNVGRPQGERMMGINSDVEERL